MTGHRTPVRTVIADDHHLFRAGLAELLGSSSTIEIVGQASSGQEVLALVAGLKPRTVVLDVSMPGPGPVHLIRRLIATSPPVGVVVLTMHDDPHLVADVLEAGAAAYLLKNSQRDELISAVHLAARSENEVLIQVSRSTALALVRGPLQTSISPREEQVLHGLDQAKTNKQIGAELHISDATVKRHLTNIYDKLGAISRVDAIRKAHALGLLKQPY